MAGAFEAIGQRAEDILGEAGDAAIRAADELPAFARLLRQEIRLRLALSDITLSSEAKRELLSTLLASRVTPVTLEAVSVLTDYLLSPEELERATDDLAVRGMLAGAEALTATASCSPRSPPRRCPPRCATGSWTTCCGTGLGPRRSRWFGSRWRPEDSATRGRCSRSSPTWRRRGGAA